MAVAGVLLIALLGIQQEQRGNPWFDVLDESAHYDYVLKLADGHIPAWGSTLDQDTMLLWDCLGNSATGLKGDCAIEQRSPGSFAAGGYSYEAQQPPLGYLAYVPGYLLSEGLSPSGQLNIVRDVGGVLLLLIAGVLIVSIASQARFGFFRTLTLAGLTLLAPITIHAFSTVSNDAATLVSALVFILGLQLVAREKLNRRPSALVAGVIVGVVLGGVKGYMILLPAGAFIALAVLTFRPRKVSFQGLLGDMGRFALTPRSLFLLTSATVSAIVAVAFTIWQSVRELIPASIVQEALGGFLPRVPYIQWSTVVSSFVNLTNNWYGSANGLTPHGQVYLAVNTVFLIGIGIAIARKSTWRQGSLHLAVVWLSIAVIFSIGWSVLQFVQGGFNFDAPLRYGLPLLPIGALAVAIGWRRTSMSSWGDPGELTLDGDRTGRG
ncbi:hypothetical protein [Microbacterium sp. 4NA327F11]|uniref:hypothetical protein n=1 Tax=Microbacterium sp. 4NA327F11 TaxID=2502229 RepID=UPI0010F59E68|nr:hypothetical protein [Microbacterium sp. 4NA327F11]